MAYEEDEHEVDEKVGDETESDVQTSQEENLEVSVDEAVSKEVEVPEAKQSEGEEEGSGERQHENEPDDVDDARGNDDGDDDEEDDDKDTEVTMEELRGARCRLHDILIRGNKKTKDHIIERELKDAREAETFEQLQVALLKANQGLRELGVFESIRIILDVGPPELPGTANVIVSVKEAGSIGANIGTYVQGQEKSVEGSVKVTNLGGYAEAYDLHVSRGEMSSNSFGLGFHLPQVLDLPADLDVRVSQTFRDLQRTSSHTQILRGASLSVASGSHEGSYELTWRENTDLSKLCSSSVRRQLGHSLLSAVKYSYFVDRRDNRLRPRSGYAFRTTSEFAGVGLDPHLVRYFRQEFEVAGALPISLANAALTSSFRFGALLPWGWNSSAWKPQISRINDRFVLGGPDSLRGFRKHGIGPTDVRAKGENQGRDSLGGDFMFLASMGVSFDLPIRALREIGLHGHAFASAGSLLSFDSVKQSFESASKVAEVPLKLGQSILESMRVSTGLGLVWPTALGRIEANYCWVLRQNAHDDHIGHGLQLGFNTSAP